MISNFRDKVMEVVRNIPAGTVMTYGQVAKLAGSSRAARAVGNIMKQNYLPDIPCHRVVRSDGTAGGYNRGAVNKIFKLKKEGVRL
ncbi:MAG: MGMT family protein [Patescibacteria group bacterium]